MIDLYDALSPLLILGAFLAGRWTASRKQIRQAKADLYDPRFWERESLVLTPEEIVRASEGL